jgi:hypothetical protein
VFLEELAASGMHLGRQRAGELITGRARAVATLMRVTEATARRPANLAVKAGSGCPREGFKNARK